jgi:hypothetical protein
MKIKIKTKSDSKRLGELIDKVNTGVVLTPAEKEEKDRLKEINEKLRQEDRKNKSAQKKPGT